MKFLIVIFTLSFQCFIGQTDTNFVIDANQNSIFYYRIRDFEDKFGLDKIENGYDSLQIRIWYYCSRCKSPRNLFIFKRHDQKWIFQLTSFDPISISTLNSSAPDVFSNKLLLCDIMTLPNMKNIKKLHDNYLDGDLYFIETSTLSKYRLYYYHMPKKFKRFKEVRQFLNALDLIKKEFGIPLADEK